MPTSQETELAAIALEEQVTTTANTEEEETNELMDWVFGDRQASDSGYAVEYDSESEAEEI